MRWFIFPVLLSAGLAAPRDFVVEDFEGGAIEASRWKLSGPQRGRAIVTGEVPAFQGASSLKISVQPGDNRMIGRNGSTTERFELTLRSRQVNFEEETWYAFALRVPATFPRAATRTLIHQFKENVRPIPVGLPPGAKHCQKASPVFALYLRAGRELAALVTSSTDCDHTRHELGARPLLPDRWHEVVVHARPSHSPSGLIEVWVDGDLLGRYRGFTGYVCHGVGYIDTQPRFGIYRDAHPAAGPAEIYYDAIRFAPTREGLRLKH